MLLFTIEVVPTPDNPDVGEYGGAFANCWVDSDDETYARQTARDYLIESGWLPIEAQPIDLENMRRIERADVEHDPAEMQYYSEAEQDGACFVLYVWPIGAEE